MRGSLVLKLALTVVAILSASAAAAAPSVDIYIRGTVLGRVPGKNAATVEIRWEYKCLGDRLGEATYNWTLRVVRKLPRPEQRRTLMAGTTKTGSTRIQLAPGKWEPIADPFRCETERGAGSTAPEIGADFVVPDYCAWSVAALRGEVGVEQGQAVKALSKGDAVRPGDLVFTRGGASLELQSRGAGSSVVVGKASRVRIDPRHCGRLGGWKFALVAGAVTSRLAEADRNRRYEIDTANAVTLARRATWTVEARTRGGQPWTRVSVRGGSVTVSSLRAPSRRLVVRAGASAVVSGSKAPSRS